MYHTEMGAQRLKARGRRAFYFCLKSINMIFFTGAMYGNGSYFAMGAAYSNGYAKPDAQGNKRMYLALVLVGDHTLGQAGMIVPPAKGVTTDLYDSVTDNVAKPTMFVIFNDVQAYPEFLITFK